MVHQMDGSCDVADSSKVSAERHRPVEETDGLAEALDVVKAFMDPLLDSSARGAWDCARANGW